MTPPPPPPKAAVRNYVYLLRSFKDGKFYLGWTTDLKRRLFQHNSGMVRSTMLRRPFELLYYECYMTSKEAKEREKQLKRNPNMFHFFKKRALRTRRVLEEVVG